mmetsp:Transcript_28943/g.48601  ORF Transcript_28943/g.48601 Transcript_28943/m.48601 type:complete len:202 (-) Transcript_28943:860-1465(-)
MRQHFNRASPHVCFMVRHALFLAERLHQLVHFGQVVARQHGEEVVVHLVLQPAAEPVYEHVRGHVAGGGHLQLPEVRALVGGVDGHAVVAQAEDDGQEEAAHGLRDHEEGGGIEQRHVAEHSEEPHIVQCEHGLLGGGVGHVLAVQLGGGGGVLPPAAPGEHPALVRPGQAREQQHGEVEDALPLDQEASRGGVLGSLSHL